MARLFLSPGNQTYGPIPGGEVTQVFGTNEAERVSLSASANAVFDPSFVRGNDAIAILGNAADFDISATVAGITISSDLGANIRIPAFGGSGGLAIDFNDLSFELVTNDNGATFELEGDGSQVLGGTPTGIGSDPDTISLDIGSFTVARTVDAGGGNFAFTDDAKVTTNVVITGIGAGDTITVTNARSSNYNFGRDFGDPNDLVISYSDPNSGATNRYVFEDVLPETGAVNSYNSAIAALGFEFITFG